MREAMHAGKWQQQQWSIFANEIIQLGWNKILKLLFSVCSSSKNNNNNKNPDTSVVFPEICGLRKTHCANNAGMFCFFPQKDNTTASYLRTQQ